MGCNDFTSMSGLAPRHCQVFGVDGGVWRLPGGPASQRVSTVCHVRQKTQAEPVCRSASSYRVCASSSQALPQSARAQILAAGFCDA